MLIWHWFQPINFQLIWLSAVLGGNQWIVFPIVLLCLHFVITPNRQRDLKVLPLAIIGITLDAVLTQLNIFKFVQYPFWLVVLWLGFVLNFGHSLKFLRKLKKPWLMIIGSIGGCYAYLASWKLGAVALPLGAPFSVIVLLIAWALILPLLVKIDLYLREGQHE